MFDVSFSELVLILVVGLLVFGPEKLPEVIRTASQWIGKAKRTFTQMRTEIEREIGVDELKRDLHNNAIMQNLRDVHGDLQRTHHDLQQLPYDVKDVVQRANSSESINHESTHNPEPISDSDPTIYFDPRKPEPTNSAALTDVKPNVEEQRSAHTTTADNSPIQK